MATSMTFELLAWVATELLGEDEIKRVKSANREKKYQMH
jgi:hypothetical protein